MQRMSGKGLSGVSLVKVPFYHNNKIEDELREEHGIWGGCYACAKCADKNDSRITYGCTIDVSALTEIGLAKAIELQKKFCNAID